MVVTPVVAPRTILVPAPSTLDLATVVLNRLRLVVLLVTSPPSTLKSPSKSTSPATFNLDPIPTPPATMTAPVDVVVDCVVSLMLIATPFAKFQSAPVTSNLSSVASSYLIFVSLLVPNVKNVSSGTTISPVPFGSKIISPSTLLDDNVFKSNVKLSTFH